MANFTDIEKELLSSVTDDRLRSNLEKIREAMEDIWGTGIHIIQDYTDHGVKHSERVAGFAYKLLKANDGRDISSQEMYLLLASIYLHDIGMQCDVVKFPEIKTKAEELGAQFAVDFKATKSSGFTTEEQKEIRKNHHYLSAAWIDYAYHSGKTVLSGAASNISSKLVGDLMDVCKYHAKLPINDCPSTFRFYQTERKQMVAALLRFSDELDIDRNRVDSIEAINSFNLDPQNRVYWWLHNCTNVDFIASNVVVLTVSLHPGDKKKVWIIDLQHIY